MSLKRQLLDNLRGLAAMALIAVLALVCGAYILLQERVEPPFTDRYEVRAAFTGTAGLTPGAGQPVNVAGVQVGQVGAVDLVDGQAVVTLRMDPAKLPRVFTDARVRLVPRTPLKDLQLELAPGRDRAHPLRDGAVIPVAQTTAPIDADELLAALDGDTRQFLRVLLAESGRGLDHRGRDVRAVLRSLRPTATQLASITRAVRARRTSLAALVHELSVVATAAGARDAELARLVDAGNATLGALAAEEGSLRGSVRDLPATLTATRASLRKVSAFTAALRPALARLRSPVRRVVPALAALDPVTKAAPGIVDRQLRPLVREARPLVRDLRPVARELSATTPDLTSAFKTLTYVTNELAYNAPGDDEGFLYWLAWFGHNGASFLSTQDANGPAWRGMLLGSCSAFTATNGAGPVLGALLGTLPVCAR